MLDKGEPTTLSRDNTTLLEGTKEELEVWLLEESLGWALWVGGVGDDDIKLVLVVVEELEAVSNVDLDFWVLVGDGHSWEELLGETDDGLVMC